MTGEAAGKREFINMLIAFTYAMRDQLRGDTFIRSAELLPPKLAAEVDRARYKPLIILRAMSEWIAKRRSEGAFSDIIESAMDRHISELTTALGGCDRIANTPVPFTYSVMIHRVVYFYCALLPFGLVDAIAWMTPPVTVVLAYSFIALDSLAAELETPFRRDDNGLPLDAISLNIELSLREMSGETMEKKPLQPVDFVLY
jgi:putative membrane protein